MSAASALILSEARPCVNSFLVSRPLWSLSHSPKTSITRLRFLFSSPASLRGMALSGRPAPAPSASPPSAPGPAASPAAAGVAGLEGLADLGSAGGVSGLDAPSAAGGGSASSPSPGGAPSSTSGLSSHPSSCCAAATILTGLPPSGSVSGSRAAGACSERAASVSACASRSRFSCIFCSFFSCSACLDVMCPATAISLMRICTRCHVAASSCAACPNAPPTPLPIVSASLKRRSRALLAPLLAPPLPHGRSEGTRGMPVAYF